MSPFLIMSSFFSTIKEPQAVITAIQIGSQFHDSLVEHQKKYTDDISCFSKIIGSANSSDDVLCQIRDTSRDKDQRMSLLKLFRRCVSSVCDTEMTKKIKKVPTQSIIDNYGDTFVPIEVLKANYSNISGEQHAALACLLGENDLRGQVGYYLTEYFFTWVETDLKNFHISGPRGAGSDIQLNELFEDFEGDYPIDFVLREKNAEGEVVAIGFARYDSTRGGSQSDDRTGGNSNKVDKAKEFCQSTGNNFKLIFLADGPGLTHGDTWKEACTLDDRWNGNVRVTTLKTAQNRITKSWLLS